MRNLKRALSLTLASVMLLGMMVVGASAKGYPDVSEEDNVEAIEVLQAIEVMRGDDNGNFNPDSPVTRSEMAVVMALLLNYDYQYFEATCPFWDVPTWARPYVGACYTNKIVAGYNDNTYGAADGVTPVQAASMMMRALGYFQNAEDYADGFELSTVRQGTAIGIFDGVGSSATSSMTRNQVAKMALNALQSEMVTFTGTPGTTYTASSGETLSIGYRGEYTPRTSTESKYQAIERRTSDVQNDTNVNRGQYYVQLGEELYNGELRLDDTAIDAFGRPSRYWQYKGDEIGTYAKKELLVAEPYNVAVKGRTVYEALGSTTIKADDQLVVYVNGAVTNDITRGLLVRSNNENLPLTGRGVLTEVYRDTSGVEDEITIVVVNTWLAQAVNDYNTANETIRLDVYYRVDNGGNTTNAIPAMQSRAFTIDVEDFPIVETMKANDLVRVTMAAPDHTDTSAENAKTYLDYSIESIDEVETIAGVELSDYSAGNYIYDTTRWTKLDDVTAEGVRYNANVKAFWSEDLFYRYSSDVESALKDAIYNLYLDQFGNLLGIEQVEKADNYIFVVGYDQGSSVLAQALDQALIIHTDGTMETVTIDDSKLKVWNETSQTWVDVNNKRLVQNSTGDDPAVNTWCTYSVKSDGTYVLDRIVKNQGIQNRYVLSGVGAANPEKSYIDSVYSTLTSQYDRRTNATLLPDSNGIYQNTYSSYKSTGHDMRSAVAYGNSESVYITVDADTTVSTGGSIVKVNSVATGVRNVSIRPKDTSTMGNFNGPAYYTKDASDSLTAPDVSPETGIDTFFIYNDKGYVTYAVVVGTNGAAGYEYLYLNSSIKRDYYDKANDRHLYDYELIRDGELVTMQSEVNKAYTAAAGNGKLPLSASATADPTKGDLVRASVNKDGIITEMVILPETALGEMNGELNDDYGYTLKVDRTKGFSLSTPNPLDRDGANIEKLRANGYTLWVITERTEDMYTLLTDDVKIFVRNPSGSKEAFTVYTNAESAVNAVNNDDVIARIDRVATINDNVTGFASTVIIDVTYAGSTPVAPNYDTVDLVLSGDLFNAKVYYGNDPLSAPRDPAVNGTDLKAGTVTYKVPKNTTVTIVDENITWTNAALTPPGNNTTPEILYRWLANGVGIVASRVSNSMYLNVDGTVKTIELSRGDVYGHSDYRDNTRVVYSGSGISGHVDNNNDGSYTFTLTVANGVVGDVYNVDIQGEKVIVAVTEGDNGAKVLVIPDLEVTPKADEIGRPTFTINSVTKQEKTVNWVGSSSTSGSTVNSVNLTIGQPVVVGATLPTEIDLGGAVAKITWYYDGEPVVGNIAEYTSGYTQEIEIIPNTGFEFAEAGPNSNGTAITVTKPNADGTTATKTESVVAGDKVTFDEDNTEDPVTEENVIVEIASIVVTATMPTAVGDDLEAATVAASANYTIKSQKWDSTTGKAVLGENKLTVTLTAKAGCLFKDEYTIDGATVTVNDTNTEATVVYTATVAEGSNEPDETVTVTAATVSIGVIAAGAALPTTATVDEVTPSTVDTSKITAEIEWAEKDAESGAGTPETAVAGKTYVATITLTSGDDSIIVSNDAVVTLKVGNDVVANNEVTIEADVSAGDTKIETVAVTMPEYVAVDDADVKVTVAGGEGYNGDDFTVQTGTAGDIPVPVTLNAKDGYVFDENVEITGATASEKNVTDEGKTLTFVVTVKVSEKVTVSFTGENYSITDEDDNDITSSGIQGVPGQTVDVTVTASNGYAITAIGGEESGKFSTKGLASYKLAVTFGSESSSVTVTTAQYVDKIMNEGVSAEELKKLITENNDTFDLICYDVEAKSAPNDKNDGTITVTGNVTALEITDNNVAKMGMFTSATTADEFKAAYNLQEGDEVALIVVIDEEIECISIVLIVKKADGTLGIEKGDVGHGTEGIEDPWTWVFQGETEEGNKENRTYTVSVSGVTFGQE